MNLVLGLLINLVLPWDFLFAWLAGLLRQKLNLAQLEILRISPVLGVHTGPGIVGSGGDADGADGVVAETGGLGQEACAAYGLSAAILIPSGSGSTSTVSTGI